jgi:ABC-type multidrug transport system, permease component
MRTIKKEFLDIYYVWVNEMKVVFSDSAAILLFILVPLLYPLLYGFIYNNETVREVAMVVVDNSHSSLSREFVRKVDASPDVRVIGYASDMIEAEEAMKRKEAYGILYFPHDFSRNLHTQKQTQVNLYADMRSLLYYKSLLLAATEVSLDMGAGIRVEEMGYKSQIEDEATMQAVTNEWISLYNPQNGFGSFLVPAVLILIIQQTLLLGIGTIMGTHRDRKRFTVASQVSAGKKVGVITLTVGKAFCYSSLYLIISAWVFRVIPYIFKLPQIGDPITLGAFLMPYLLSATFFAMTLSYFCSQREFAMLLFVFTSVPFLFLSGISWPWVAVPAPLKAVAYILPSTPGIHGFVKINTMGAALTEVWFEYIALWIQAGIYCIAAAVMYKWWIRNYDPEYQGMVKPVKKAVV